ncbi:MAG: xanthine dehydrogenase family protein molybdopterin-binding subunit [Candidatus Krumholzibacteria bacterium]|nr:xanthine dehydrogenase family protein molybdopterin-binding subunit [Candidatus Krumholzibacteria bacterium]
MSQTTRNTSPTIHKITRRRFLQAAVGAGAASLVLGFRPELIGAFSTDDEPNHVFYPSVYIEIPETGNIRLIAHRQEMGQGIRTALPMLLAEELEVRLEDVEIVQAVGDPRYGNQTTDGSASVRLNWDNLRKAGAAAREMLVRAAAQRWGVEESSLRVEAGVVHDTGSNRRASYGELASDAAKLDVPREPKLKPPSEWTILGKDRKLVDAPDIVTGQATYGADIEMPGLLIASLERPPTVGGKLVSFDASRAKEVPGVRHVFAIDPQPTAMRTFGGVAVVADNTWAAMEGRAQLEIEWDRGSASEDSDATREALQKLVDGSGRAIRSEGDFVAAKASAAKVHEAHFHGPYLVHAPMEPPVATVLVKDGNAEVWAPTQDPQTARFLVARALGMKFDDVTVNVTLLGGAFGRKAKPDFILEAAKIAQKLEGTPVKLQWTREDEVRYGYYRAQYCQKVEACLDETGKLTGWRHHTAFPTITSTFTPGAVAQAPFELGQGFTNMPYRIPNVALEASGFASDLRIGWLRSVCNTFHAHAVNCAINELAELAGRDPVAYRLELLGEPRTVEFSERDRPYGLDTGRLTRVIEAAAELSGWGKKLPNGAGHGFASHFSFLTYVAMAVQASVDNGKVKVHQVDCALDCGAIVNPDTVRAQIEGAVVFGLSFALYGEVTVKDGVVRQGNFDDYPVLQIEEMPEVRVELIHSNLPPSGVGEPGVPPVAPALTAALNRVTGKRYRDLPLAKQVG